MGMILLKAALDTPAVLFFIYVLIFVVSGQDWVGGDARRWATLALLTVIGLFIRLGVL